MFECGAETAHFGGVVDAYGELSVEESVVAGDVEGFDTDSGYVVERFSDAQKHAFFVDAADVDGGFKEVHVDVPGYGYDVVAEVALEFHGAGTVALVDVQMIVFRADVAQGIVSGDRVAAGLDDALVDVGIGEGKCLFAVYGVGYDFCGAFLAFTWLGGDEGQVFSPAF